MNSEFENFFENLSQEKFKFLLEEYNFKFFGFIRSGTLYSTKFKNATTGIVVSYEIGLDVRVYMIRLVNGEIGLYSLEHWFRVEELVSDSSHIKIDQNILEDLPIQKALDEIFTQYSNILRNYGQDILRGDFSIFVKIAERNEKRHKEIIEKFGVTIDENFAKFFETLCKDSFKILITEYGFKFVKTETQANIFISCIFKNSTTGVKVGCEVTSAPPTVLVNVVRLSNGKVPLVISGNSMPLPRIIAFSVSGKAGSGKSATPYLQDTLEKYFKDVFADKVKLLKKYCHDILNGDFTIFDMINASEKI
ncbi:MAG: hypothetical protein V1715_15235 [bacterium]